MARLQYRAATSPLQNQHVLNRCDMYYLLCWLVTDVYERTYPCVAVGSLLPIVPYSRLQAKQKAGNCAFLTSPSPVVITNLFSKTAGFNAQQILLELHEQL